MSLFDYTAPLLRLDILLVLLLILEEMYAGIYTADVFYQTWSLIGLATMALGGTVILAKNLWALRMRQIGFGPKKGFILASIAHAVDVGVTLSLIIFCVAVPLVRLYCDSIVGTYRIFDLVGDAVLIFSAGYLISAWRGGKLLFIFKNIRKASF